MADEEWADDMKPVLGEVELPSNFESILPDYPFKVADFKGPLDLLIHLIKTNCSSNLFGFVKFHTLLLPGKI